MAQTSQGVGEHDPCSQKVGVSGWKRWPLYVERSLEERFGSQELSSGDESLCHPAQGGCGLEAGGAVDALVERNGRPKALFGGIPICCVCQEIAQRFQRGRLLTSVLSGSGPPAQSGLEVLARFRVPPKGLFGDTQDVKSGGQPPIDRRPVLEIDERIEQC